MVGSPEHVVHSRGFDKDGDDTAAAAAAGSLIAQLRSQCEQLSQKCGIYEQEVTRLSGKLERFIHEVILHCTVSRESY